ncbi:MAG: response regulator [Patescibacteria group bacterium]
MTETAEKYVLLIEDDPALQKAYQMKFETHGVKPHVVENGREALQLIKQSGGVYPSVVILDLLLPYVSGFEILERIRETEGWRDVPVVIVSNLSEDSGMKKAESLGVKNYFIKTGINLDEAVGKILSYVRT